MILYNVTVNIDKEVENEWLDYMKKTHIPEVMETGAFVEYRMFRLLTDEEEPGTNYAIMYYAKTMEDVHNYQQEHAERLQKEHTEKYKDRFVAYRSMLESV